MKSLNELIKNNVPNGVDPMGINGCILAMCGDPPLTPDCSLKLYGCGGDPPINPPLIKDTCVI